MSMAKKIDRDAMFAEVHTEEAEELVKETQYGLGSPVEARIAAAFIENARNLDAQNKGMSRLMSKMGDAIKKMDAVAEKSAEAIEHAGRLSEAAVIAADNAYALQLDVEGQIEAISNAVTESLRATVIERTVATAGTVFMDARQQMIVAEKALRKAEAAMEERAKENEATFAKGVGCLDSAERSLKKALRFPNFYPKEKVVVIALSLMLLICTVASVHSCAMFAPITTGEVQIVYGESYQGELDSTRIELARTQNELAAYKAEYPEGLSKARQHEVNEKNSSL